MKFGQSSAEHEASAAGGGSTGYIKYLRKGDNRIQIVDEYENWVWYWEHYNPGGFPFPCTQDRKTCPGCTSSNEKMSKASRRAAFNAFDGQYTNVWKVPKTVAEKLKNRADRIGTITDRPYVITQIKNNDGFYDYDIEGQEITPLDMAEIGKHTREVETLLAAAYDEAWGDSAKVKATTEANDQAAQRDDLQTQVNAAAMERAQSVVTGKVDPWTGEQQSEAAPFEQASEKEEKVYSEAELRAMNPMQLRHLAAQEGLDGLPSEIATNADAIVDWMLTKATQAS